MKKLMLAALAATTLAAGSPALAQGYRDYDRGDHGRWDASSRDHRGYWNTSFDRQYDDIQRMIRHGRRDGSYTPDLVRRYSWELRQIQSTEMQQRRAGRVDVRYINGKLEQLRYRMSIWHDRGHQRMAQESRHGW